MKSANRHFPVSRDFNTICFWSENVLSLYYGRAEDGRCRPFSQGTGLFSGQTIPMTGKSGCLVVFPTCHIVFLFSVQERKKPRVRPRQMYSKVKNVKVRCDFSGGWLYPYVLSIEEMHVLWCGENISKKINEFCLSNENKFVLLQPKSRKRKITALFLRGYK